MYLQQFDFEITHRPGKENTNADALSRNLEIECNFIGVKIEEEGNKNGTPTTSFQFITNEIEYDGDSESDDNSEEDISDYSMEQYTNIINFSQEMEELQDQIYKIKSQKREVLEEVRITTDQIQAKVNELLNNGKQPETRKRKRLVEIQKPEGDSDDESTQSIQATEARSPTAFSCCGEIWCNCTTNNTFEETEDYNQEYEAHWSEKHAEDIISHYTDEPMEQIENENGWGPEYYNDQHLNEAWGLPDLSDEIEQHIDEVWGIWTVAWTYSREEVTNLINNIIETKWVVANQPMKRGKWKCDDYCDVENHHLHSWCTICQRRIDREERLNHNCRFGIGRGQVHPDMNPDYLYNDVFWQEPFLAHDSISTETNEHEKYKRDLQTILEINERHKNELNGEGSSRTPLIENQTKPHIGKRFQSC
jgi:hypothetical protein